MAPIDELFGANGPFASVYLRSPSAVQDAEQRLHIRWKNARRHLESLGAPHGVLVGLDADVAALEHHDGASLAIIRSASGEHLVEPLVDELVGDLASFGPLPRVGAILESRQRSIPHLMVITDRTGADLVAITAGAESGHVVVEGEELHIHRGHPGGWSQRRFQQRAENRWEANAREVAEHVSELARQIDAQLITIAGDVRAAHFLLDHLDGHMAGIATLLEAGDAEHIADETVRAAADVAARDTTALLKRLRDGLGQGQGSAADAAADVLAALSAGRVSTLLVHDDPGDERTAYFRGGDDPACSATAADGMTEARLVDVAIRSARATKADVHMVPASTVGDDRVAALLRW